MKNNLSQTNTPIQDRSHVVYEFVCDKGECMSPNIKSSYIGLTTMSLKERMSAHRYQGSIFKHFRTVHGVSPKIDYLLQQSKILYLESDPFLLAKFEALHIRKFKPILNENISDFTCLKLNIY